MAEQEAGRGEHMTLDEVRANLSRDWRFRWWYRFWTLVDLLWWTPKMHARRLKRRLTDG